MSISRSLTMFVALVWFAGCANCAPTQEDARVVFAGGQAQYIVITVRNPATLVPRAG